MICVIAEKPSVAKEYAKVMGGALQKHDGYLEGNGFTFTWAFGHLIELCMPADYGLQTYVADKLPLIPDPFKTQIKTISKEVKVDGKKTFQKVPDPGVIKQLKIIENLFNNCSEIYVGTDAGREGELIFRYIYEYFKSRKPFKKLTTYPRTGSRYIGEDVFEEIPALIENAKFLGVFPEKAFEGLKGTLNNRCVNAEKVTDHHALLPTENRFPTNSSDISVNEKTVYQMIVSRMLEAFNEVCIKDVQTVKAIIKDEEFKVFGTVIKKEGWRSVTGTFQDEEDKNPDEESSDILPLMVQGEILKNMGIKLLEKETKPKPIHTEASLLKAMETCGKDIADEEMRDAMKDSGLGTPATRAAIIETLFTRDYIERKKKLLIPTTKGLSVYHLVKEKKIATPEFTGEWERFLALIEKKQVTPAKFMEGIKKYSHLVVTEILNSSGQLEAKDFSGNQNTVSCPKCKNGQIRKGDKSYYCTEYKNGCDFKLWVEIAGKKLTEENIKSICEKGKTGNIKGFKGKN